MTLMARQFRNPQGKVLRGESSLRGSAGGFNNLAAGNKVYGGGRPFPNTGKTSAAGKAGYSARDARRRAIVNRNKKGLNL